MVDLSKRGKLVGEFIRKRREALNLSQRSLGLLFSPPVTTQFISNVERGVTPLPPAHIPTLTKALNVSETELMALMEQEYAFKLSGRLGRLEDGAGPGLSTASGPNAPAGATSKSHGLGLGSPTLPIADVDYLFMRDLYEAYQ